MADYLLSDTYNGELKILVTGGHSLKVSESYIPYVRPDKTIVFQFSDTSYDPTYGSWKTGAVWTQVSSSPNVWEYYRNDTDWHSEFDSKFTTAGNSVSVVEFLGGGIIDMRGMFMGCTMLSSVANLRTPDATMASSMFYHCSSLGSVRLNMPSCTTYSYAFDGCTSMQSATITSTASATTLEYAFNGCTSLTSLTYGAPTSALVNTSHTFSGCTSFTSCVGASLAQYATNTSYMYDGCSGITSLSSAPVAAYSTDVDGMYRNCVNCASGQYSMFQTMSGRTTPPSSHSDTFLNCGSNSQSGSDELALIPTSWGGTLPLGNNYTLRFTAPFSTVSSPVDISVCEMSLSITGGTLVSGGYSSTLTAAQIADMSGSAQSSQERYRMNGSTDYLEVELTANSAPSSVSWKTFAYYAQSAYVSAVLSQGGSTVASTTYNQREGITVTLAL